ncbi:hypothetical protein HNY73_001933 [Argiope bruennichi]|uniref:Uncharacterized protein n=1 Tax=Argiope bruennichi TaxID=94029 RepID=A0A8T0FS42_ARGBR|nr:hypothetical protein HNY73_001933 [Argiope bruennichi]
MFYKCFSTNPGSGSTGRKTGFCCEGPHRHWKYYITKETAKKMKYPALKETTLIHTLFGGGIFHGLAALLPTFSPSGIGLLTQARTGCWKHQTPLGNVDGVPRVARIRTSHGERIRPFQRLYPLEVSAKTEIGVLKIIENSDLSVEKTPDLPTDHVPDSPADHVPNSPVERTDISEEIHHTKTRLGRTIKVPRKLDL